MTAQQSSIEVYCNEVIPTLGERHRQILHTLHKFGNMTNMELSDALGWSINRVTPRVNELRKKGRVSYDGNRVCSITGRFVMSWSVIKRIPKIMESKDG